jgi:hypothetical protein
LLIHLIWEEMWQHRRLDLAFLTQQRVKFCSSFTKTSSLLLLKYGCY